MDKDRLAGIITFLKEAERLKDTLRSGYTAQGKQESTAEHTWRLTLMAMMFSRDVNDCNLLKLLKLCIIHDLGEALSGDIPAIKQQRAPDKSEQELADLRTLCESLPQDLREEMMDLWAEYEAGETREAVFAKGFDKLETILKHNAGSNPSNFDYAFNLNYGKNYTDRDPLLAEIRVLLDSDTNKRMAESK
ncbi:MAG: HD domain-containing protein [Pseudomonadota bacterium]